MAMGDQSDFTSRLLRLLPIGWFPSAAPRLNAALQGAAAALSAAFAMLTFVRAQTRVQTASGSFLDLISEGYFAGVGDADDAVPGFHHRCTPCCRFVDL
jgi:hypothetical protein